MKVNFCFLCIIAMLLYGCQNKSENEESAEADSIETSNMDQLALKKWLSFKKESDSIINLAQLTIDQGSERLDRYPHDERLVISQYIREAQTHLDHFKKKVEYIKTYKGQIQNFDPSLQHTYDSLRLDYQKEKLKLEASIYRCAE